MKSMHPLSGAQGSWRTLLVVLVATLGVTPAALAAAGLADDVAPDVGSRYVIAFHRLPKDLEIGGTYYGDRIVNVDEALRFIAVVTLTPAALEFRGTLDSNVRYVEPSPIQQLISESGPTASFSPNDPSYGSQYAPAQIRLTDAWDTTTGSTSAAVCIVDTGVRYTHEDLTGSRWLGGTDTVNNDNDPMDDNGHGTHVAGIAAATLNNGKGISGSGNVGIYGAKVLNSAGSGSWDQVASGVRWCADNTMTRTVISMSLGGSSNQQVLADAVSYAYNTRGKLVVAAAGNSGPCSNCVDYPGKYTQAIAVSCTKEGETLCSFSSTGPEVEIAAPGDSIYSTYHTSNTAYTSMSGTSMSTPYVSGVAALVWSHATSLTNSQLRTRLQNTAQDIGASGRDNNFGYGEVDAKCLIDNTAPCGSTPPPPPPGCGASGPANDCFADPTAASGASYTKTQSTSGATTESGEPAPCGSIGSTVWYTYTPSAGGTITVETTGSSYDTALAAYTGSSLSGLTQVGCNDDISSSNRQSRISWTGTAGTTYRIQAGGYSGATGSLTLQITGPAPAACGGGPANDCFADPTAASGSTYTKTQSTTGATLETGEPRPCGSIGGTVWFTYTPSASGTVTVETTGSSYDTALAAYTGSSLSGLTQVACNDDVASGNLQSKVTFTGTAGTTYRIQAGGYNGATGSLTLKITGPAPASCGGGPANDCFTSPTAASGTTYTKTQSTTGATLETGEPRPCGSIGGTVWFTYTPTTSGTITVETTGSSYDTALAAYTGSSLSGLTNVACNDDAASGNLQSKVTFTGAAGTTYRIQAGGYNGATGSLTLKITGTEPCPGIANDCFNTATPISSKPYTNTQSTSGATLQTNEPRPCGSIGATVWYTYTPSTSGTITIETTNSNYDTALAVYTGSSLTALTNVACNDDTGGTLQSKVTFTATAGVTYRIQAGGYGGATGDLTLKLS